MLRIPPPIKDPLWLISGLPLSLSGGVLFVVCEMLLNNSVFSLRILFVLILHNIAYSVDEPLDLLKHHIRDSYRQHFLTQASSGERTVMGKLRTLTSPLLVPFICPKQTPYTKILYVIFLLVLLIIHTASINPTSPLILIVLFVVPLRKQLNIFSGFVLYRWQNVRLQYPTLLRLFTLVGSQWPNCYLHCGWIENTLNYGLDLVENLQSPYESNTFVYETHHMYLHILLARFQAYQVLSSTPCAPPNLPSPPLSILSSPLSYVQTPGEVSPISVISSPG